MSALELNFFHINGQSIAIFRMNIGDTHLVKENILGLTL
jgi:hypothetical protein